MEGPHPPREWARNDLYILGRAQRGVIFTIHSEGFVHFCERKSRKMPHRQYCVDLRITHLLTVVVEGGEIKEV